MATFLRNMSHSNNNLVLIPLLNIFHKKSVLKNPTNNYETISISKSIAIY